MFVSILQLMSFSPAKPVHSRADGKPLLDVASMTHQTRSVDKVEAQHPRKLFRINPSGGLQ